MKNIKIHSITDLITNSSTTIFTRSENSEPAVRDMFKEISKTLGVKTDIDQMFKFLVLSDSPYVYFNHVKKNWEKFPEYVTQQPAKDRSITIGGLKRAGCSEELVNRVSEELLELEINTDKIEELYTQVREGKKEKPDWFTEAETKYLYSESTILNIIPLKKKYSKLAESIISVIYSTSHISSSR